MQAPGWAEDEAGLFAQSVGISEFMMFVVEKPGSAVQLVFSLRPAHLYFMLQFVFFSYSGPTVCGAKLVRRSTLIHWPWLLVGLFTLGVITWGCAFMWHGDETSNMWMDDLWSSVVVLLLLLPVVVTVQVTRRKLFCSPCNLQVKEVTLATSQSSELWINSLAPLKNRWCLLLSGTLFISRNS